MRNTFLDFNDPKNHESGLRVATLAEWDQILKANRGVSQEQRRYFICDCFEDCGELDRMYIETSKEEFDKWHSQRVETERKRKAGSAYGKVLMNQTLAGIDDLTYDDVISDGFDLEKAVMDDMSMNLLRKELSSWKDWAITMLDLYLTGKKKEATYIVSDMFDVSIRTVQRWKEMFEEFVKNFFENL